MDPNGLVPSVMNVPRMGTRVPLGRRIACFEGTKSSGLRARSKHDEGGWRAQA